MNFQLKVQNAIVILLYIEWIMRLWLLQEEEGIYMISWLADTPKLVPQLSWSWHQNYERGGQGWDGPYFYIARRRSLGSDIYKSISEFQNNKAWCHEMPWHQRLQEVSLYQFILTFMSILQSSTELVHIGCIYICV